MVFLYVVVSEYLDKVEIQHYSWFYQDPLYIEREREFKTTEFIDSTAHLHNSINLIGSTVFYIVLCCELFV